MSPPVPFQMLYLTVLFYSGCFIWYSSATSVQLQAIFSMGGIKGNVMFYQSQQGSPTSISLNLTGIENETLTWDIRQLPMIYDGNAAMSCSPSAVGDVFDPAMAMKSADYNSSCSQSSSSRFQVCATGDLTGMLGAINASNAQKNFTDQNLTVPIRGANSIMGRTLVLYKDGTPRACSLISPDKVMLTAVAVFTMPVAGFVYLRQADESADTSIFVNLFHSNDAQSGRRVTWQINQASATCGMPGDVFNPENRDKQNCSQLEHEKCVIGDLTSKHGNITVSMATRGQSKTKVAFTDTNLPLTGVKSVIGKTITLFSSDDSMTPFACAKIMQVKPRVLISTFKASVHDGVDGYFKFTQLSPFDPTMTEIRLTGLRKESQGYHIHNYPMPWQMKYTGMESCAGSHLGGHWNPFGVDVKSSPSPGTGTNDQYEIGDLSGKYGTFLNLTSYTGTHLDYNLPLFGKNSIQGRSVVIHKMKVMNSMRWVCADVHQKMAEVDKMFVMKTKITFTGPDVMGYILLIQYKTPDSSMSPEETSIYVHLSYGNEAGKQSMNHSWHVHVNPEGGDTHSAMGERCKSLGGHYNPYNVDLAGSYKSSCFSSNMLRCEVGDLSGKHARLNVGSGKQFYTDPSLPLFGEMSVVGRGVVVHAENAGAARLACATIKPVDSLYVEKTLHYVEGTTFSRLNFTKRVSALLNIPEWRIFYIRMENSQVQGCMTVKFGIMGNEKQVDEPSKAFDLILQRSSGKLMEFQPKDKCRKPETTTVVSTSAARANFINKFIILSNVVLSIALCMR